MSKAPTHRWYRYSFDRDVSSPGFAWATSAAQVIAAQSIYSGWNDGIVNSPRVVPVERPSKARLAQERKRAFAIIQEGNDLLNRLIEAGAKPRWS